MSLQTRNYTAAKDSLSVRLYVSLNVSRMHVYIKCSGSMMITFLHNRCLCGTCYTVPLQLGGRPELPFNNHSNLVLYVCVEGSVGVSVPVPVLDLLVGHSVEGHLLVGHLVCHQEYRCGGGV